ncbi:MAG: hypothetical protein OEM67_08035 [Thermoleophilia bacterium]|nr:hypothetical protein [Thermoleophilia bacterium]MDH3725866.1 hypothetical protein [Thermoleophilia bacterium]
MSTRFILASLAIAAAAVVVAGCSSDPEVTDTGVAPSVVFRPSTALIGPADLPAGFFAVESARGEGLCGFRLADLADNGARGTFQNNGGKVVVEHVVLQFSGAAPESFDAFEKTVDTCPRASSDTHDLTLTKVPVALDADRAIGVQIRSTNGRPPVRALTIVVRQGREIFSITTTRTDKLPSAGTAEIAQRALERLRRAQRGEL